MEDEPVKTEFLSMAQAARTLGGKIFVQVLNETEKPLSPSNIDLPSHLVDNYIIANNPEKDPYWLYNKDEDYKVNGFKTDNIMTIPLGLI